MIKEIHICMGLPGSGKTTWVKEQIAKPQKGSFIAVCDVDKVMEKEFVFKDKSNQYKDALEYGLYDIYKGVWGNRHHKNNNDLKAIIIDGPIFTNETLKYALETVFSLFLDEPFRVYVHYWKKDIDNCLLNDKVRCKYERKRNVTSEQTIKKIKFEKVNEPEIKEFLKNYDVDTFKVRNHEVYQQPKWKIYFYDYLNLNSENKELDNEKMYSQSWSGGGSYGNCYNDSMTTYSGEEPLDFKEFDAFVEKTIPDLRYLDYLKIKKECIEIEETFSPDYYGGGSTEYRWSCNLRKLYDLLEKDDNDYFRVP